MIKGTFIKVLKRTVIFFGKIISNFLLGQNKNISEIEKVFVLHLYPQGIGDLVMLSPLFNNLKISFPGKKIYIVTEQKNIFEDGNFFFISSKLAKLKIKDKKNSSLIISPTFSLRNLPFLFLCKMYIGYFFSNNLISNISKRPGIYKPSSDHYYIRAKIIIDEICCLTKKESVYCFPKIKFSNLRDSLGEYICIAPIARWKERQYPIESYIEIIESLAKGIKIILVGDESIYLSERIALNDRIIDFTNKTTINELCDLLGSSKLFIGNDSGPAHIAIALQVPSIVIFGCVGPNLRVPIDSTHCQENFYFNSGDVCNRFPCFDGFNKPICKNHDKYACIKYIEKEDILNSAQEIINKE